jgi:hypothetical protein
MKRCPTCGNTYTNDQLVFCLEDGATLLDVKDSRQSFDPQATLRISAEENIPPTLAADFKPQGAPTQRQPPPPQTVPPRAPHSTSDRQMPQPHDVAASAASPPSKSTSPVIVAGITAIVVLLLVIAGIGIALLVRNSSSDNTAANTASGNGTSNREAGRNASNMADDNGSSNRDSSNKASTNNANRNSSTATDPAGRAEAKVVRGAALDVSELTSLSGEELRRLRNAVYARHGRTFDSPDLQRYFESRPWYKARYDYSESELTETDHANIKLIQTEENSR